MNPSNKNYANRVKLLKKAGFIDKSYNLNNQLTTGQKSFITKKYNEVKQIFTNPQGFGVRTVSRENAKAFADSGYKTVKTAKKAKVFIPIDEGAKLTVKGKQAWIETPTRTYKIIASKSKDLHNDLIKYGEQRLPKNQFLTVTVGNHRPIHRKFDSAKQLEHYLSAKKKGGVYKGEKIDKWNQADAIRHITIVEILDVGRERRKEIKKENVAAKQAKKKK